MSGEGLAEIPTQLSVALLTFHAALRSFSEGNDPHVASDLLCPQKEVRVVSSYAAVWDSSLLGVNLSRHFTTVCENQLERCEVHQ